MRQSVLFGDVVQGTGVGDEGEWKIGGNDILRVCYCIDLLRSFVKGSQKSHSRVLSRVVYTGHKRKKCYLLSAFPIFCRLPYLVFISSCFWWLILACWLDPHAQHPTLCQCSPSERRLVLSSFCPKMGLSVGSGSKSILNCSPWLDLNDSHSWEAQRWHWGWIQY